MTPFEAKQSRRGARPAGAATPSMATELKQGMLYSEELGIDLPRNNDAELFKWFLASVLFGARITETIARNTYRTFERYGLLDPQSILNAGWDFLVNPVMREGGYVRYDGKTSTEIFDNCRMLLDEYGGSLLRLHQQARDSRDLEARLQRFRGVGPVTVNIFLRELRPYWPKSNPAPLPLVIALARRFHLDLRRYPRKSLAFIRMEAGLIRLRKTLKTRGASARRTGRAATARKPVP
jgi:endonuclease III